MHKNLRSWNYLKWENRLNQEIPICFLERYKGTFNRYLALLGRRGLIQAFILIIHWCIRRILKIESNIWDAVFCENGLRLGAVNCFFKSSILDVWPSSEYVCVALNVVTTSILFLLCTLFLVWCNQSIGAAQQP